MTPTRRPPRRDPYQLFHIQSDFAAGLAPHQIAAKHGLPLPAVLRIIRRRKDERLLNPFNLRQGAVRSRGATQLYWVGYIAAAGRLFLQGSVPTLVLTVDRRDTDHVTTMIDDLCTGHPTCEWCESSRDGLQAYVRDRELAQMLAEWGAPGADPSEGSVPVALIPSSLLSHFVRGYLEGGRGMPPFGRRHVPLSHSAVRHIALEGPKEFLAGLNAALSKHAGTSAGDIRARRNGLAILTYRGRAAARIVQFAYRGAERSLPRTASLRHPEEPSRSRNGAGSSTR
ncbi:MAG: hypothetical protein E6H05_09040 [Bacillati bacterium ANGP1]|uniref:Uncharacterized protein n=1 Tax=Candidatus Segetimicrobium genomatis TaxID=2569760 RepID=A0A537IR36_9BACT|nr:MAG: hypothetical protein E6H05_09040 [Terrabacteria group bacterium ANGP1]